MNLLKGYFDYMENPAHALQQLVSARSMTHACLGYFAAALSTVVFFNVGDGLSVAVFLLKLAILFVAELTAGAIIAASCALFLDVKKINASPAELFVLVGTSGFIKGVLIAFALISAAVPQAHLGYFAPFALLLVFGLQVGYLTRGVMRAYATGAGEALTAWIFSVIPAGAVFILIPILGLWGIIALVA